MSKNLYRRNDSLQFRLEMLPNTGVSLDSILVQESLLLLARKLSFFYFGGISNMVKACENNNVERFDFMSGFVQVYYDEFSLFNKLSVKLLCSIITNNTMKK